MTTMRKLPHDVHYTRRGGGVYVRWNGRPEGQVQYTYDRATAYGLDDAWVLTPYQGADGSCRIGTILRIAAEYIR